MRFIVGVLLHLCLILPPLTLGPAASGTALFTEANLQALLAKNPGTGRPVDSIAELVPLLPRDLRGNFTFVYDSRSPFRAYIGPDHPRTILFSSDGRLVLTFTGDPAKAGSDVLETMAFDDGQTRFDLHTYILPAAQRRGFVLSPEAADCAGCHGADARPIYDSYPVWPGFYGSVLDTFPHDALGVAELKTYAAFLGATAKSGVYQSLIFPKGSPTTPYLDPRHVGNDTVELSPRSFPFMPNTRLGMALTELNRRRIFRKLSAGPTFAANEKRILAELLDCRGSDGPIAAERKTIDIEVTRENVERLKRMGTRPDDQMQGARTMQELDFVRELAALDKAATLAGVDRSDWSMAMEPGSLAFFDGILSGIYGRKSYYLKEDLIDVILEDLARREPAFHPYFASEAVFANLGYPFGHRVDLGKALASCPLLGSGNRAALNGPPKAP